MSTNNESSLLGFLKKKSLFSNSPTKNPGKRTQRSRSKSRDSKRRDSQRDVEIRPFDRQNLERLNRQQRQSEDYDFERNRQFNTERFTYNEHKTINKFNNDNVVRSRILQRNPEENIYNTFTAKPEKQEASYFETNLNTSNNSNDMWTGLVKHASTFQSARIESSQCLETLAIKLRAEVSSINYKIDSFNAKMIKTLNNQFKNLKEKMYIMVEQTFKESERVVKEYMREQEQELAGDILKMKDILEQELTKVQTMREQINKPSWRKVAGQILSTDLEQSVEDMVKKSAQIQIGQWRMKDVGAAHLKSIELQLKQMIRMKQTPNR